MNDEEAAKIALWQAIEGYSGLWEIVWEFNTVDPSGSYDEHCAVASSVIRQQIKNGWVELFYSIEPGGDLTPVPTEAVSAVLSETRYWHAPQAGDKSVRVSATPAGEAAYRAI